MHEGREELERRLLREPFDAELRTRYARQLYRDGAWEASLEQWRLLLGQAGSAERHLHAAACCERIDDRAGAERHALEARRYPDFDEADPLHARLAVGAQPRPLFAIAGGKEKEGSLAEIVSIGTTDRVRFADVVGMEELKKTIRLRIIEPFVAPGLFQRFKKRTGGGVLLYGPPGCGKTMIARAIATECRAAFTAVGISDILSMWVGSSERNLAALFEKARSETPSVLFFDELDALAFSRSKASADHTRTLVNEFLAQLDGMAGHNAHVLILAATNMPWDVDDAMKRPGRFDRQIFVPPPDAQAREEMFRAKLRDVPVGTIDAKALAERARHFSGADIDGVIDLAKEAVLAEIVDSGEERTIDQPDLVAALEQATASTLDWLQTARNLVKFGGASGVYRDVERYLRAEKLY
jgi:ATP-dependent 26S proteasome regulatory subunit